MAQAFERLPGFGIKLGLGRERELGGAAHDPTGTGRRSIALPGPNRPPESWAADRGTRPGVPRCVIRATAADSS
jgi:hypothetical protein